MHISSGLCKASVLFGAGDIFSSVKVLYFFNNSWIGGIKLMFHAWGVKDERERREASLRETKKKKSNWKTGRKWQGKKSESLASQKVTDSARTLVKGTGCSSTLSQNLPFSHSFSPSSFFLSSLHHPIAP